MPSTLTPKPRARSAHASSAVKALAIVLQEEFNTPFSFYDATTGKPLVIADLPVCAPDLSPDERALLGELVKEEHPKVACREDGGYLLGFPLDGFGPSRFLALGVLSAVGNSDPERAVEKLRISKWARAVQSRLRADCESRERRRTQAEHERQAMIAWEAIMGLDKLHRSLRIHKEPVRHRRRILRTAGELFGAQSLVWVSLHGDGNVVQEGESLLSPWDCGRLASQLTEETRGDESSYLVVNDPRQNSWGTQYPRVTNLLAVRVAHEGSSGWLLAFNKMRGAARVGDARTARSAEPGEKDPLGTRPIEPFTRSDVMLVFPFASLIGLHVRATQSYVYIKDILIGLTRALTAAIDAKDAYTYGHSERVARAAVELGRELGLQEAEQNDIYLAGLLHDIGKIGVRDAILSKREPLTDEELAHIRQHPVIGHRILADLHAIAHLLPGVLYHHELYDGSGYPAGLKQDAIPFLAPS